MCSHPTQAELVTVKRTVQAECDERIRLLSLLQQLQHTNGAADDAPPSSADATLQTIHVIQKQKTLPAISHKTAFAASNEQEQAVYWGMQRQPGKRGGRGGHGR